MPNKGTILELRNLWTKESPIRHRMFLIKVGVRREMCIQGL
jgi:hypothetical protein